MNEAFINGFVKRAADYGVSEAEAIEILEKQAIIGPAFDIANLGVPSGLGALIGRYGDMDEYEAEKVHHTPYGLGKGLLIPGYTGYHIGRKYKSDHVLRKNLIEKRKQKRKTEEEKKK